VRLRWELVPKGTHGHGNVTGDRWQSSPDFGQNRTLDLTMV